MTKVQKLKVWSKKGPGMSLQKGSKVFKKGPDMSLLKSKKGPGMSLLRSRKGPGMSLLRSKVFKAMKMKLCFKSIELRMVPWLLDLHLLGKFIFDP